MLYVLDCRESEIDKFKTYKALDIETCRLQQVSGNTLLKDKSQYKFGVSAYQKGSYDFKTNSIHIRVIDNAVFIENMGILYVLAGAIVESIYRDVDIVHVRWRLKRSVKSEIIETKVDLYGSRVYSQQPIRATSQPGTYAELIKKADILKTVHGENYKP